MNASDNAVLVAEIIGRVEPDAPTIVLSAGLGGAAAFWLPQIEALAPQYRVVLYDHRGTGRNPATLPDGYSIGDMADEVIALLQAQQIERCHFMGHALGGLVGLELALRAPQMLDRLVLVNAWAAPNPHTKRMAFATSRVPTMSSGGSRLCWLSMSRPGSTRFGIPRWCWRPRTTRWYRGRARSISPPACHLLNSC